MLNLKKEAEPVKYVGPIDIGKCPACESYVSHIYFMQDSTTKKQSKWYSCQCGVVWNTQKPDMIYNKEYLEKYSTYENKIRDSYEYPVRIYAPIIEELLYGRRALLVGKQTPHQENALKERGWVCNSIDKNKDIPQSPHFFCGDFEDFEFPIGSKFHMLWIYHTLECFIDPIMALRKAKELLTEDGILFIGSPDTDFIHTRGSTGFIHWKPDKNYLMWNRRSLSGVLEKLGFNVILARQNYEHRFPEWDDFHIIAQRKFF